VPESTTTVEELGLSLTASNARYLQLGKNFLQCVTNFTLSLSGGQLMKSPMKYSDYLHGLVGSIMSFELLKALPHLRVGIDF